MPVVSNRRPIPFRLRLGVLEDRIEPPHSAERAETLPPEALTLFKRAAGLDPHDPDYHFILGRALARAGRIAEALTACREAVQLAPQDADYHGALGAVLWEAGAYEEAQAAFSEALRLRPDDTRFLNGLGCALTMQGQGRKAVSTFHAALRQDRGQAHVYGNLAVALWEQVRHADALRAFREAIRLRPDAFDLHHNLALALGAAGRNEEAVDAHRRAAGLRPADAHARLDLAEALYAAGRQDECESVFDAAVELDPAALAARPRSREIRDALRLQRLRADLRGETRVTGVSRVAWRALVGAGSALQALVGLPRKLAAAAVLTCGAAVVYAGFRLAPPYVSRYLLEDDVAAIAGAPVRDDADVLDRLLHAVRDRGLEAYIGASNCEIRARPKWRRIVCRYEVPVRLHPGFTHTLRFRIDVERPYLTQSETLHF